MNFEFGFDLNLLYLISNETYLCCLLFGWHSQSFRNSTSIFTCFSKGIVISITSKVRNIQSKTHIIEKSVEKIGLNTKNWGTLKRICFQELQDLLVFVLWFPWDLFINLKAFGWNPNAFNFAINNIYGIVLQMLHHGQLFVSQFLILLTGSVVQYTTLLF